MELTPLYIKFVFGTGPDNSAVIIYNILSRHMGLLHALEQITSKSIQNRSDTKRENSMAEAFNILCRQYDMLIYNII